MSYAVKEIFYSLQGEGARTGRAAVFCRFAGCNLWSGREVDRSRASCGFCDTDFVGINGINGGRYCSAEDLAAAVGRLWPSNAGGSPYVILTGGEPLLQVDSQLVAALHDHGFEVGVETNGTVGLSTRIDWVCVSPKANSDLVITAGDELKLVYPQAGLNPENYLELSFTHFFLQPLANAKRSGSVEATVQYCLDHPRWRLSLQTHKLIGIE